MTQTQVNFRNTYKVFNGYAPTEGSRALPLAFDFSQAASYSGDLVLAQNMGNLEFVQSVFVDNSANSYPVTLSFNQVNQSIVFPPYAQGYMPVLVPNEPRYTIASSGNVVVDVIFLTFPMPAVVWSANSPGSGGASSPKDYSSAPPALSANLLATAPANPKRTNIEYQNQSANQHQLVLDDGAGNGLTIELMAAGTGANAQGAAWSDATFKGRVRIYSGSAGDQCALRETTL